jgi:hypothetical protein
MKYWPGRSSSATQFAFLRDPEKRSSDSTRSSAVLLEKERERSLSSGRSRSYEKGLSSPQKSSPSSLIATQAINGRINVRPFFQEGAIAPSHRIRP